MKKTIRGLGIIALVAIIGLTIAACGGGGGSPSATVRAFLAAVGKGDAKAIEKTATPETASFIALFGDEGKEALAELGKITNTTEKIDGDTAVVSVTYANGETEDIDLVKVDGKWKVNVKK